eukprot:COSAG02_NODE_15145_length_1200_cov_0.850136_1_plen_87_part_00
MNSTGTLEPAAFTGGIRASRTVLAIIVDLLVVPVPVLRWTWRRRAGAGRLLPEAGCCPMQAAAGQAAAGQAAAASRYVARACRRRQ